MYDNPSKTWVIIEPGEEQHDSYTRDAELNNLRNMYVCLI